MLKPYGMKMIIESPAKGEAITKSGIVLPGGPVREKWLPIETKVIAVGPGTVLPNGTKTYPEVKAGDTVLLCINSGEEIQVEDGTSVIVIDSREAIAVVEDGNVS